MSKAKETRQVSYKLGDFEVTFNYTNDKLTGIRVYRYTGFSSHSVSFEDVADFRKWTAGIEKLITKEGLNV